LILRRDLLVGHSVGDEHDGLLSTLQIISSLSLTI